MTRQTDARNHTLQLSDKDVAALERSVRTRHSVLGLTGDMRATEQVNSEADLLAHVGALVQEHTRPGCGCIPHEDRKVV